MTRQVTRLAPSPTGALHLGNARTFLANWLLARQRGWRIALRIEDLDGPRVRVGAADQAIEDLRWLGLDWDDGPLLQSQRRPLHAEATAHLLATGRAYACVCTRTEIERAASAPHADDGAAVYPGTCRGRFTTVEDARRESGREPAIRFLVDDARTVLWHDAFAGAQAIPMRELGDFVIAKGDGTPSYQLAVVVDDAAAGVTQVVRGDDLIDSTPRQIALYEALNLGQPPTYWHLPLLVGADGRRLAKRHGDTRIASYRERGFAPSAILQKLAGWCGIDDAHDVETASDLLATFDIARMPHHRVVVADRDDGFRP